MHRGVVSVLFVTLSLGTVTGCWHWWRPKADVPVNVNLSGVETATAHVKDGVFLDATFEGWVGGTGPVPDGWVAAPGEGGQWKFVIDFCCASTTGPVLTIVIGSWKLKLPDGSHASGSVEGGTVRFPLSPEEDLGCGPGVTKVNAVLLFDFGGHGDAEACLNDVLHPFPFPLWGTLRKH